jgi:VRR-NUC domain.
MASEFSWRFGMAERDIVAGIIKMIRGRPKCFCWKEHGGMYGTAGIPDIIACINGRFVAFEVKTQVGKTTKIQEITIQKIKDAGGNAYVVRSVDQAAGILDNLGGDSFDDK